MSESDGPRDENGEPERRTDSASSDSPQEGEEVTQADIEALRAQLDRFEEEIDDRTVHRDEIESDLKQYVRRRLRRGHARGWGPYLVLLYGTIMTLGAFYYLEGGWAVFAMIVVWLSTLGLYTLMLIVGLSLTAVGVPGRLIDRVRNLR